MTNLSYDNRGTVTLAAVILLFFSALAVVLALQLAGLGEFLSGYADTRGTRAFHAADACLEEALLRLARDDSYPGGSLSMGRDSCTMTVTGTGETREIEVSGTSGTAARGVRAEVTVSGASLTLDSWQEDTD